MLCSICHEHPVICRDVVIGSVLESKNRLLGALKVTVERIDDAVLREWQVVV